MQSVNRLYYLLFKIVTAVCALLMASCSPAPSDTSHSVVFTVSLDDGPATTAGFSWVCQYSLGFSERDMAKYVDAKSVPVDAAVNYVEFSGGRFAVLRPSQWPHLSAQGLCTTPPTYGWEGFLLETEKPIATLTWFRDGADQTGNRRISISNLRSDTPIPPSPKETEVKVKQLLSASSIIVAYYFELPHFDDNPSDQLSPAVVNTLKALPKDRPSLLRVANPANIAYLPRRADGISPFVELPDFQLANSHPYDTHVLPLNKLDEPVAVPGYGYRTENARVSMLGVKSSPKVLFPLVKEAVALMPMAAVWYPATKQLIVVNWEDDSDEVLARLK